MIAIIGTNKDDILYYDSIISNKKKSIVFDQFEVITGNIFNQEVIIVYNLYTSYLSSAMMMYILEKNFVNLVIVLGKSRAYSKNLKVGEILISKNVMFLDVNQIAISNSRLGQIPDFPLSFNSQLDVIELIEKAFQERTINNYYLGTVFSSSTVYTNIKQIEKMIGDEEIFTKKENIVIDSISGGAALACYLHKVPFISISIVEQGINDENKIENYLEVLDSYAKVGRAVVTFIGNISRKDVIR